MQDEKNNTITLSRLNNDGQFDQEPFVSTGHNGKPKITKAIKGKLNNK
jgi:hypothetical protein